MTDLRTRTLPGPDVGVGRWTMPAYRLFALFGLALGLAVATTAARFTGVAWSIVAAAAAISLIVSLVVVALRVRAHAGDLVWSEHEAVVLVVALAVGAQIGGARALLDVMALGLLVLLACGRIGCLLAGCCHGRPGTSRLGAVRYAEAHARLGFPAELVGRPLLAVQAWEAIWAAGAFVLGAAVLMTDNPPGAALVVAQGLRTTGRAVVQQLRGDPQRSYGGLAAPEWWALGWACLLVVATVASGLPLGWWTAAPVGTLVVLGVVGAGRSGGEARSRA